MSMLNETQQELEEKTNKDLDDLQQAMILIDNVFGVSKTEMHKEICEKLNDTYIKKNHDYGDSFGETFNKLGIISAITRISDKYNRLVSLCTKTEEEMMVKDESITDTLLDMANYCIMTVIELRKNKQ